MQFNSVDFMIFFPIVLVIHFIIPKKLRIYWLLVASYYFYMSWNAQYALLIGGSTIITYLGALLISRVSEYERNTNTNNMRKATLIICISINLGILFLFKYGNWGIESLNHVLNLVHISTIKRRFDFLLPVGISFYTFQALGYLIDVYRGETEAETNIFRYALFVSFFPQLVAGPIERSKNLLAQMKNIEGKKLWDAKRVTSGAIMMVWGLFMKMVIADRVSIFVDTVFDNYRMQGSVELIAAAIGFAIQIYCDFGSYSMIAIGAARILGFDLMENFNAPYFAKNIQDFWDRWHISLSTWFRDYLYIPLGGNRKGKLRKAVNLLIVFLASGLWHGASWHFVVWGGIHGLYRVVGDAFKSVSQTITESLRIKTNCFSWRLLMAIKTFCLVTFAWIFFRADSLSNALLYIKRIFIRPNPWILFDGGMYSLGLERQEMNILIFSIVILVAVDLIRYRKAMTIDAFLFTQNIWFEWTVVILLIVMIFIFGEYGPAFEAKQFIYFQF